MNSKRGSLLALSFLITLVFASFAFAQQPAGDTEPASRSDG